MAYWSCCFGHTQDAKAFSKLRVQTRECKFDQCPTTVVRTSVGFLTYWKGVWTLARRSYVRSQASSFTPAEPGT